MGRHHSKWLLNEEKIMIMDSLLNIKVYLYECLIKNIGINFEIEVLTRVSFFYMVIFFVSNSFGIISVIDVRIKSWYNLIEFISLTWVTVKFEIQQIGIFESSSLLVFVWLRKIPISTIPEVINYYVVTACI